MRRFFNDVRSKLAGRNERKREREAFEQFKAQVDQITPAKEREEHTLTDKEWARRKKARKIAHESRRVNFHNGR